MASRVTYKKDSKRDPARYAPRLRQLAHEYAERVQKIYTDDVTGTWRNQPDFPIEEVHEDEDLIFNVAPEPGNDAYHIFRYVDEGTSVRKAKMTFDFVPKTAPRQLRSGQGRGGLFAVDGVERPGIKAREFGAEIVEQLQQQFLDDVRAIFGT